MIDLVTHKYCIFSVYGPPEVSSNQEKNNSMSANFWSELQKQIKIVRNLYNDAIIIIAGDFNARLGRVSENTIDYPPFIGTRLKEKDQFN